MKNKQQFHDAYLDGTVLETKIDFHARYSSIPIDLPTLIATRLGVPSTADLLDIGCGTGQLIEQFTQAGHSGRLVGLDLVRPLIGDTARKQYVAGDSENLPFPRRSFDLITCVHTLSHLGDLDAAMREALRVLRNGGRYLATANSIHAYPHTSAYRDRIHREFGWGAPTFTTTYVNAENLEQTLAPHWRVERVDHIDGELRIPVEEYPAYFHAHIATWDHSPTTLEQAEIFRRVTAWARDDQRNGCIIEPKRIAVVVATKPSGWLTGRARARSAAPTTRHARSDRPQRRE